MKIVRFYLTVTILHLLLLSLLYTFIPGLRFTFTEEDQFLENLTTIYYFDVFFLGLILWLRVPVQNRKISYITVPIIGLVCFLDEISFIEQLFGAKTPVIWGVKIDALHDLLSLVRRLIFHQILPRFNALNGSIKLLIVILSLSCISFFLLKLWKKSLYTQIPNLLKGNRISFFFLVFIGSIILSQAIDLHLFRGLNSELLPFLEELFEMNAALTLLFASSAIQWEQRRENAQYSLRPSPLMTAK